MLVGTEIRGERNCESITARDWGIPVVCLHETMLETCAAWKWRAVGCGSLKGYLTVIVVGCSGGLVAAWNETVFS